MDNTIIAIDGPSGTGKSITAKLLAHKLNFIYIDSGIFYRSAAYLFLEKNIKPNEFRKIDKLTRESSFELKDENVFINGRDITKEIRTIEITNRVTSVSRIKEVRINIVEKIRKLAENKDAVIDGKDIGTVVFPDAQFKFYLVSDLNTRAARRQQEFLDDGIKIPRENILKELERRDELDSKREFAPLRKAKDAIEVDTTNMIIEEQVDFIFRKIISSGNIKILN